MIKYLSLFSGIGSPEQALKNIGVDYELIGFSEIDKYAIQSYCAVHGADPMLDDLGDITKIDIESLPVGEIDLVTHGSPCQDFSVAGNNKGGDEGSGTRSSLMWNTVAICEHCKPKYVVWENVKNVLSKKHKHNFDKYISEMDRIGYNNYYKVLNAKDFGVPQNRERVFVVSIRKDLNNNFEFPEGYDNGIRLKDLLEDEVDERYYINTEKAQKLISEYKGDLAVSSNIRSREFENSGWKDVSPTLCARDYKDPKNIIIPCITPDRLNKRQNGRRFKEDGDPSFTITSQDRHGILQIGELDIKGNDQIKRVYDAEGISPCLSTMQGGNRQPKIIEYQNYRIRKLTPLECWRLMGFKDEQFRKAEAVCSNSQLYKQAGNSIVVNVMEEIFKELFKEELKC